MTIKITNKISPPVFVLLALVIFSTTIIQAAPGDLDLTFGGGGVVVTPITDPPYYVETYSMRVQPDGKILVSGLILREIGNVFSSFFLVRYNSDGTLDASFGTNGKLIAPINTNGPFAAYDLALQPDGKIVSVGFGFSTATGFAVNRYNANGTPDASFGTGGSVITPIGNGFPRAQSVAVQADGKIVIVGYSSGASGHVFNALRYDPNGTLDTSFGTGGIVSTSFDVDSVAYDSVLQPDGKIVAVGYTQNSNPNTLAFALARYNTDGSLDPNFGVGGKATHSVSGSDVLFDAVLQPDGKIVATGNSLGSAIIRFNTNGSLDMSFATDGIFRTQAFGLSYYGDIAAQSNGKPVAFGTASSAFGVARLDPNGTPDTGFGNNGIVNTPIGTYPFSHATAGAIQADGRILAFGKTFTTNVSYLDIAIARYLGDSAVPPPAQFDFDGDGRADVSVFRPDAGAWYLLESTAGFTGVSFGNATDKITPADLDGDGKTDVAVFRPSTGTWYWLNSSNGTLSAVPFGSSQDLPTPADYDADGKADLSVFRPSNGVWYRLNSSNGSFYAVQFGVSEDKPTLGDFDGDGKADVAVYRPSNGAWYRLNSSTDAFVAIGFGLSTDLVTPADFDGDGKTDVAVYRPSAATWYSVDSSTNALRVMPFGSADDQPTAADFDGDGKADVSCSGRRMVFGID